MTVDIEIMKKRLKYDAKPARRIAWFLLFVTSASLALLIGPPSEDSYEFGDEFTPLGLMYTLFYGSIASSVIGFLFSIVSLVSDEKRRILSLMLAISSVVPWAVALLNGYVSGKAGAEVPHPDQWPNPEWCLASSILAAFVWYLWLALMAVSILVLVHGALKRARAVVEEIKIDMGSKR